MNIKAQIVTQYKAEIIPLLEKYGIEVIDKGNADIVITYGGDGSLLIAERNYPDIPKLPLRDTRTSKLCNKHSTEQIIADFVANKYSSKKLIKLVAHFNGKEILALNDIFIHPLMKFLRMYIWHKGFRDGFHGAVLCGLEACSEFTKYAKVWNLERLKKEEGMKA